MLMRRWVAALMLLGAAPPAMAESARTFVPTSDAIRMVEIIARAQGYDLSDRHRYFFDIIKDRDGKPLITGYTTFEFQWDGSPVNTIALDDHSGLAVDTASCTIFTYPALRQFQSGRVDKAPASLKEQTGCDDFRTVSVAKPLPRRRR